jgi:hypothetical protein
MGVFVKMPDHIPDWEACWDCPVSDCHFHDNWGDNMGGPLMMMMTKCLWHKKETYVRKHPLNFMPWKQADEMYATQQP